MTDHTMHCGCVNEVAKLREEAAVWNGVLAKQEAELAGMREELEYATSVGVSSDVLAELAKLREQWEYQHLQLIAAEDKNERLQEDLAQVTKWNEKHLDEVERLREAPRPSAEDCMDPWVCCVHTPEDVGETT